MRYRASELHKDELQTNFHWIVDFSGAPFASLDTPLKMRMTSGDLPKANHQQIDLVTHGYPFPKPGIVVRSGTITLTAYETVDHSILAPVMEWYSNIYSAEEGDMSGKQKVPEDQLYGTITMAMQNAMESEITATYKLHKCLLSEELDWGATLEPGPDGPDYFKPVLSFSYAWFNFGKGSAANL